MVAILSCRLPNFRVMRAHGNSRQVAGIILVMGSANERRCYYVTPTLIAQAHSQDNPWVAVITNITSTLGSFHCFCDRIQYLIFKNHLNYTYSILNDFMLLSRSLILWLSTGPVYIRHLNFVITVPAGDLVYFLHSFFIKISNHASVTRWRHQTGRRDLGDLKRSFGTSSLVGKIKVTMPSSQRIHISMGKLSKTKLTRNTLNVTSKITHRIGTVFIHGHHMHWVVKTNVVAFRLIYHHHLTEMNCYQCTKTLCKPRKARTSESKRFQCWDWNVLGETGQCSNCWYPGSYCVAGTPGPLQTSVKS